LGDESRRIARLYEEDNTNMEIHNSLENRLYTDLLSSLICGDYADLRTSCKQAERDLENIEARTSREGLGFLTKTLPSLGKALDKALSKGTPFTPPSGFARCEGQIPKLFGDLFRRIFATDGSLRSDPCPRSVSALRQICFLFYKLEVTYDKSITDRFIDEFVDLDQSLPEEGSFDCTFDPVLRQARALIERVLCSEDFKDIVPHHGPGSVSTGESSVRKSRLGRYYPALESVFPFWEYFRFNATHVCDTYDKPPTQASLACAKITLVPKDSRGPRIISMEPLEIQWIQQGIKDKLYKCIESHPLTRGFVNFTDQGVNRGLAMQSSIDGKLCTLDMKEASDRVSLALFKALYERSPLYEPAIASRSPLTRLPNGRKLKMRKFAPMGSALCFPVEALTFWSLAVSHAVVDLGVPWLQAIRSVWVYGDDLIVPVEWYDSLPDCFAKYALKFNELKCCTSTEHPFRESCGLDAFEGHDVTPIRIKKRLIPRFTPGIDQRQVFAWLEPAVSQSNLAYERGLVCFAEELRHIQETEGLWSYMIPTTRKRVGILTYVRDYAVHSYNPTRWNKTLQKKEVLGVATTATVARPAFKGYEELLRNWYRVGSTTLPTKGLLVDLNSAPLTGYADRKRTKVRLAWSQLD
jgi:hypothetical protein